VTAGGQLQEIEINSFRLPGSFVEGGYPPLRHKDYGNSSDFWLIFKHYYDYVNQNAGDGWHPLSVRAREIIASRRVSLPSEVLSLSVGVEGVASSSIARLKELLRDGDCVKQAQPDDKRKNLEEAIQIIKADSRIDAHAKQRILNAAKSWLNEGPMDLVEAFLGLRGLPRELFHSWKALRHRGAHGSGTGNLAVEDTIKLRNEVLHLFYSLVLAIIGYDGIYSDYSQSGWPKTVCHSPACITTHDVENE
jgi:hypothetical protein